MDKKNKSLETRLEVAARINKNAALQKLAIKDNDIKLLGKLIKRQQGNIDKLVRIYKPGRSAANTEKDAESRRWEEDLNSMLKESIQLNSENIASAEALKTSIGRSLYNLKVSGNAIRNGYFGGVQPRRGRYFDRKK